MLINLISLSSFAILLQDQSVKIWKGLIHFGGEKGSQFADIMLEYIFFD